MHVRALSMLMAAALFISCASAAERGVPRAGVAEANVFLAGEPVVIAVPAEVSAASWQASDDAGNVVASGVLHASEPLRLDVGIGWYRIEFLDEAGSTLPRWTSAAVLAPIAAPIPPDSPVCVDTALAWFERDDAEAQQRVARLAALAGVNWVRDRMRWGEMEPSRGQFAERTTYDTSSDAAAAQGLRVLQVFHDTPRWASIPRTRKAEDLRDVYRFCRAMAERFGDRVQAWEPWNEPNIEQFGKYTIDQQCLHQKAAYLGFKAGNPEVIVGWSVRAGFPKRRHMEGIVASEAWRYFDTYNFHTYDIPSDYGRNLNTWLMETASGRPVWLTEADRGQRGSSGPPWHDFDRENEWMKAILLGQECLSALLAGVDRHFHFILGNYTEQGNETPVQFGLLRRDRTPRMGYVALAALGRRLAGAECLGRLRTENPDVWVVALRGEPDGRPADVLVAWTERPVDLAGRGKAKAAWSPPEGVRVGAVYDYLGRRLPGVPAELTSSVVFIEMASGEVDGLSLVPPPSPVVRMATGGVSPVVLEVKIPESHIVEKPEPPFGRDQVYQAAPGERVRLRFFAYNFSDTSAQGAVTLADLPKGYELTPHLWELNLEPMGRVPFEAELHVSDAISAADSWEWIRMTGDFGKAGQPVLAFAVLPAQPR